MPSLASPAPLDDIMHAGLVWRGGRLAAGGGQILPTGFAALDAVLPGGGWPANALVELLVEHPGIGELSLLLPVMRATGAGRWLAWIAPPLLPHAAALGAAGVPLERLLLLHPPRAEQMLWASRQALASGSCSAVLAWPQRIDGAGLRRLQLAAEDGATPLFLFRSPAAAGQASPAALRLLLTGASGALEIHILKRRGPPLSTPLRLRVYDALVAAAQHVATVSSAATPRRAATLQAFRAAAPHLQAG